MSYDVLIDYIIKEGEKRSEEILAEARKKADAMLSEVGKNIEDLRQKANKGLEKEITECKVRELSRAHLKSMAFLSVAKGEIIDEMYREIRCALQAIIDSPLYPEILQPLFIEGLQEMRGRVTVLANSRDSDFIEHLLKDAAPAFITSSRCEIISVIPDERITGGIEILSEDKSISIINTLWSRLEKVKDEVMPEIGKILFHYA